MNISWQTYCPTYFLSRRRANIPAANGAAADVPVCETVHFPLKSVEAYNKLHIIIMFYTYERHQLLKSMIKAVEI